jgi:cytochrome c oxidase assembly protein subunit 15
MGRAVLDRGVAERWTLSIGRFRQIALVTTIGLSLLVVAGGVVRLTGSGLGCDDWPNCNDRSFVDVSSGHTAIEQVNRLLSGLIGIPTLAMAVGAFRVRPARPRRGRTGLVVPSTVVLLTVLANGVVGGIAVRRDLHPALVQSHFLLAMTSIAFALIAVHRASTAPERGGMEASSRVRRLVIGMTALTASAIVTGTVVTGTGPHAGEEDVRRWGFDISTVARVHSMIVLATVAIAIALAVQLRREPTTVRHRSTAVLSAWMFIAVLQGGVGYVQYFTGVPEILVAAHIAGATGLWVVTVWLALELTRRDAVVQMAEVDSSAVARSM